MDSRKFWLLCCTALLPFALVGAASADTLLTLRTHQEAYEVAGQQIEEQNSTVEMWIGEGQVSRADDSGTIVLRTEPDELLVINHKEESYARVSLPFDFSSMLPPEMKAMADRMTMSAEVTSTDETQTIRDWATRRFDVKLSNPVGLSVEMVMWASTDLAIDYDAVRTLSTALLTLQPGGQDIADDLAKVEGYPVLQETTISFGDTSYTSSEELVSAEEKKAPAGTYEVPEGYTEKDIQAMTGAGGPSL